MTNFFKEQEKQVQDILNDIQEQLKTKFPVGVQSRIEKAFYMAKNGRVSYDAGFYYLVNQNENPKDFFKTPYSDKADIDVNMQDESGNTLLHYLATECHFVPLSDYLIKKGAYSEILNDKGEPALKFNAHRLNGYCLSLIEETDEKWLNMVYADGETILTDFFQKGSTCHLYDVAYQLMKKGADINLPNKEGKTPCFYLNERLNKAEKGTKGYENLNFALESLLKKGGLLWVNNQVKIQKKTIPFSLIMQKQRG